MEMKRAFSNKLRKENSGFSLVELIIAIAILGIIGVTVALMMTSSSRNYRRMSLEAQMQSEAQLVANAISEYAIDSFDAKDIYAGSLGGNYDNTQGKVLVLEATDKVGKDTDGDGVDDAYDYKNTRYVIARDTVKNELYIGTSAPQAGGSWSTPDFAKLGAYISDFSVDVSHVESDNIIDFKLKYEKLEKVYEGNYQVLMRNRAYADVEQEEDPDSNPTKLILGLNPKQVYIDIIGGSVAGYHVNEINDNARKSLGDANSITFTATCTSNKSGVSNEVNWSLNNAEASYFSCIPASNTTESATFNLLCSGTNYDGCAVDDFTISIAKSVTNADNTITSAAPKTAKVHLRRVKSIKIVPSSGITSWKESYDDVAGASSSTKAAGYVYTGGSNSYTPLVVNLSIIQKYVPYAGGIDWTIEKSEDGGKTWAASTATYASLQYSETASSTINTVTFGNGARNGQLYRITATSKFDDSKSAEYIFGVAPKDKGNADGAYSRGYYVNLTALFASLNSNPAYDKVVISKIEMGSGGGNFEASGFKLTQDASGNWLLYLDYTAHMYQNGQKRNFYDQPGTLELKVYDENNKQGCNPDANGQKNQSPFYYQIKPVLVQKIRPQSNMIVLSRGSTVDCRVQTLYYNLIGADYLGIYIDQNDGSEAFATNLNRGNMNNSNQYLSTVVSSAYGDVYNYVDSATVSVTAKTSTADYNPNPMRLRITADDYYTACTDEQYYAVRNVGTDRYTNEALYTSPCVDFNIIIANVQGANVFISGPGTTKGACNFDTYKNSVRSKNSASNAVAIPGYDENGNYVASIAKAYLSGSQYKCVYNGVTYTYNQTYHYWYR